jgi:hypothetical protein
MANVPLHPLWNKGPISKTSISLYCNNAIASACAWLPQLISSLPESPAKENAKIQMAIIDGAPGIWMINPLQ